MTKQELAIFGVNAVALTDAQAAIMAEIEADEQANAYELTPPRIKMPSGGAKAFITGDGDTIKPPLTAIIAVAQRARAYWPTKDAGNTPPMCSSPDAMRGYFSVSDPGQITYAKASAVRHPALTMLDPVKAAGPHVCATCPLSQWGSAVNGSRGQGCKLMTRLLLLIPGWQVPAIFTLPPTSVGPFDGYVSSLRSKGVASYFTALTSIGLEMKQAQGGTNYAVATFTKARDLDEGELGSVLALRAKYAQYIRELGVTVEDYDYDAKPGNGQAHEAPDQFAADNLPWVEKNEPAVVPGEDDNPF